MLLTPAHLMAAVIGIPVLSGLGVLFTAPDMSERHHLHHDTYTISQVVSRTMVLVMVFMGVLGGLTGWLCHLGVFSADPMVPLAFFVAFQATLLFASVTTSRCQVMAYDDRMFVRPWFGRRHMVNYGDIVRMERSRSLLNPNFYDLRIYTSDGSQVRVSGLLDVEQILLRIDRFDVLLG